jgi:hypothetical protein
MKGAIAAHSEQSSGPKPEDTKGVVASVLRLFAQIRQAAEYFLRRRHSASAENCVGLGFPEAGADDNPKPTVRATKSCAAAPTVDVNVGPLAINKVGKSIPDELEIERRRNLVRTLFNDFWSGAHNKPAAFVERLDQAEEYLNDRLAANGEFWGLDANTRAMLGLPPRSSSRR